MGRNLNEVIASLPADRQAKIAALTQKKVEEMIAHAATLTDFRKAVGKTQAEVAKGLGINQNAVSQLEKRSDTYVSTLRRFLDSLGLKLELSVIDKNGVRIDLPNFLQLQAGSAVNESEVLAAAAKTPARKIAAKPDPAKKIAAKASPAMIAGVDVKSPATPRKRKAARVKGAGD